MAKTPNFITEQKKRDDKNETVVSLSSLRNRFYDRTAKSNPCFSHAHLLILFFNYFSPLAPARADAFNSFTNFFEAFAAFDVMTEFILF